MQVISRLPFSLPLPDVLIALIGVAVMRLMVYVRSKMSSGFWVTKIPNRHNRTNMTDSILREGNCYMLRFCERTPRPNSPRRGDADAKRLKNPSTTADEFGGLGVWGFGGSPTSACGLLLKKVALTGIACGYNQHMMITILISTRHGKAHVDFNISFWRFSCCWKELN